MSAESEIIVCRTTRWYAKRRLLMVAMLLGFSAYFFYDWRVGYPEQRDKYEVYWPRYQELAKEGNLKAWVEEAKQNAWPESPKETDWDYKIKEQLVWGIGTGVLGLGLLAAFLVNRKKVLTGEADAFITPGGTRVPFSAVTKVDKRKWDNKGLAYVYWKTPEGAEKKAVIDDLIFDGAGKVLDRLLEHFHGDLIELERDGDSAETAAEPAKSGTEPNASPAAESPEGNS